MEPQYPEITAKRAKLSHFIPFMKIQERNAWSFVKLLPAPRQPHPPRRKKALMQYKPALLGVIALSMCLSSCSLTKVVPIQLSRVSQTESYTQTFNFLSSQGEFSQDTSGTELENVNVTQYRQMDMVFTSLLGENNWQNLKDIYGFRDLRDELVSEKIKLKGVLAFNIYIDPTHQNTFVLEGTGRFFLIREKTDAILLSGDYIILADHHLISELDNGHLIVRADLFVTRVPGEVTYYNARPVKYQIFMDTSMAEDQVFSIDYERNHKLFLSEHGEEQHVLAGTPVANMKFQKHGHNVKLLDLRAMGFLENDYDDVLRRGRERKLSAPVDTGATQ